MAFVQIIEVRTSRPDEVRALADELDRELGDEHWVRRSVLCADRDDPGRYFNIVFFDSYEEAMKNSELPAIDAFARKMSTLVDGPPTYLNLDVVEDRRYDA